MKTITSYDEAAMFHKTLLQIVCCFAFLSFFEANTYAELITFGFAGTVYSLDPDLATEFTVGEQVAGSYTFDSTAVDSDSANDGRGRYNGSIVSLSLNIGGDYLATHVPSSSDYIEVDLELYNQAADSYKVRVDGIAASSVGGHAADYFDITLIELGDDIFNSDSIPITPPDISKFGGVFSSLRFIDRDRGFSRPVHFDVTSLRLIPEPTTFTLTALALCLVATRRRRAKQGR